jgi:hypothetical protein
MTVQIRNAVFETNSSSSHSVTVSREELADDFGISKATLRSGVIRAEIAGHYGWAWKRYYSPGAKIAYLATQLAGHHADGMEGVDVTKFMRRDAGVASLIDLVQRRTGCRVEIIGADDASIDHDSVGVGTELFDDEDVLMRFIFGPGSFVQTGNDNNTAPMWIDTDRGSERYHEHRYVDGPVEGQRFAFTVDLWGSNVFMHPEGSDPVYAHVDDRDDMAAFLRDLDGLTMEQIDVWTTRPKDVDQSLAEEFVQDAVHEYLVDLEDVIPGMKFSEQLKVETTFDVTDQPRDKWNCADTATYTLKAAADPKMVGRMMEVLARHSSMPAALAGNP